MINTAEVYLWGTRIGYIHQGDDDVASSFEYDKKYLRSGIELSPFKMPLSDRIYSFPELSRVEAFHGIPGLFADSLPDKFGNAITNNEIGEKLGISERAVKKHISVMLAKTGFRSRLQLAVMARGGGLVINDNPE